jgi:hypothetical protein
MHHYLQKGVMFVIDSIPNTNKMFIVFGKNISCPNPRLLTMLHLDFDYFNFRMDYLVLNFFKDISIYIFSLSQN